MGKNFKYTKFTETKNLDGTTLKSPVPQFGYVSIMGRSSCQIVCPFCFEQMKAYVWSLSGSGKKCVDCGAHLFRYGAIKRAGENDKK